VSTRDQDPGSQEHALIAARAVRDRPQWLACLDYLRPGDTLIVRVPDRLAGMTTMAIETINELHDRGGNINSLTEPHIDTTTPDGRALFGIVAVFAQLRVDTIKGPTLRDVARGSRCRGTDARLRNQYQRRSPRTVGVGASSVTRALARYDRVADQ
jgi:DNA invertase Pin-like site-specific DNA recombinase